MYALLKNDIDIQKISIYYYQSYNFYKIYYNLDYIKILGIPFNIKIYHYLYKDDLYFIYINDKNILNTLHNIENKFKSSITCFNLLRYLNGKTYIICKNRNHIPIDKNNIDIIINKIKYINNCYVPIINII